MLADLLEPRHRAEQVPRLDDILVSRLSDSGTSAYLEKDCPALHLIEGLIAVPRGWQGAGEFSHDG